MATASTPTGSTLNSKISTTLSTSITVKVDNVTVGAIQSLNPTQDRGLSRIGELGLDGILEIVPTKPTNYQANIERIVFDRLRLPEAFKRGFINIKSQLVPFDILIIDSSEAVPITHTLVNCWFTSYSPKYSGTDFIISESSTIWFEDMNSIVGTNGANASRGGSRGIPFVSIDRERKTDRGLYRGTLDVSNIVGIFDDIFK